MKRTIIIVFLTGIMSLSGSAQFIKRYNGEVRYQYQYQYYSREAIQTSSGSHVPSFHIGASGSLIDPAIFSYNLRTNINSSFSKYGSGPKAINARQYQWNFYDLSGSALHNFILVPNFRFSDAITEIRSRRYSAPEDRLRVRKQDQNVRLISRGIKALPNTTLSWYRSHQWSLQSETPQDQVSSNYGFTTSSGGAKGSLNLSGSVNENTEVLTDNTMRYYTLGLQGTRILEEERMLDFNIDYNRFENTDNIDASASFSNTAGEKINTYTNVSARSNSGPSYQSTQTSLSQSAHYTPNAHFRYVGSVYGNYGKDILVYTNSRRNIQNLGGGVSTSVTHSRSLGTVGYSNGFSFGYSLQKYSELRANYSTSLTNALQTNFLGVNAGLNHSISLGFQRSSRKMNTVGNSIGLNLNGTLFHRYQTNLTTNYRSEVYAGNILGYSNRRDIYFQWNINGRFMYYVPFTLSLNGSANWLLGAQKGRLYRWGLSFASPRFFHRNVSMNYRISRSFDPGFGRSSVTHDIESNYRWRSIEFEFRFSNFQLDHSQSQFWFTVIRPF